MDVDAFAGIAATLMDTKPLYRLLSASGGIFIDLPVNLTEVDAQGLPEKV
jgi:hypothetical protein